MGSVRSPLDSEFEEFVNEKLAEWHVPGLAIAVVHEDQTFSQGYGISQLPSETVTPSTLFYGGSTTKAFLGAAWAQFIHSDVNKRGSNISFSTPLADVIRDDFVLEDEHATTHTTIEDALSHRTGMPRHDLSYGGETDSPQKVTRSLRHLPLHNPPRTTYEYCNLMYVAASHALESATGQPLGALLKKTIWTPLGMDHTFFNLQDATHTSRASNGETLAKGYRWEEGDGSGGGRFIEDEYMDCPFVSGAGCVISSVLDYAKWIRMLIEKGSPLSSEVHEDITTSRSIVTGPTGPKELSDSFSCYSLGWQLFTYRGHRVMQHGGGVSGFTTAVTIMPEKRYGLVIFTNGHGNLAWWVIMALTFRLISDLLDVPDEDRHDVLRMGRKEQAEEKRKAENAAKKLYPQLPSQTLPMPLPIASYQGRYEHPAYRTLNLSVDKSGNDVSILSAMMLDRVWKTGVRLEHASGDYWIAYFCDLCAGKAFRGAKESPKKAAFKIGENGQVAELGIAMEDAMPQHLIWFKRRGEQ